MQAPTKLLSPAAAAERLGLKKQTLAIWRIEKRQPLPYVKLGGRVFYRAEDLEKFIERNTLTPVAA